MWVMKRIDEAYLRERVNNGKITQDEYDKIVATPQLPRLIMRNAT